MIAFARIPTARREEREKSAALILSNLRGDIIDEHLIVWIRTCNHKGNSRRHAFDDVSRCIEITQREA